jgi:hypothetical protein
VDIYYTHYTADHEIRALNANPVPWQRPGRGMECASGSILSHVHLDGIQHCQDMVT